MTCRRVALRRDRVGLRAAVAREPRRALRFLYERFNTFGQRDGRRIPEHRRDFADVGELRPDVVLFHRVFNVLGLDGRAQGCVEILDDLEEICRLRCADIENLEPERFIEFHRAGDALYDVHDVCEVAGLRAVAIDNRLLAAHEAPQELAHEVGVDAFVLFVWAVDRHETETDNVHRWVHPLVAFGDVFHRYFCDGVVVRRERGVSFDERRRGVPVQRRRGSEENSLHSRALGIFQYFEERLDAVSVSVHDVFHEHRCRRCSSEMYDALEGSESVESGTICGVALDKRDF